MKEKHMFKKKTAPRGRLGLAAAGASPIYNPIKVTGPNIEDLFPGGDAGDFLGDFGDLPAVKEGPPPLVVVVFPLRRSVPFPGLIMPVMAENGAETAIM